jgi:CO dehydrogenase nickel-insertion accessory protein CooC1
MVKKIVATGRRGTWKSTFTTLVSRYIKPLTLLVDLDSDLSLGDMLGFDFSKAGSFKSEIAS